MVSWSSVASHASAISGGRWCRIKVDLRRRRGYKMLSNFILFAALLITLYILKKQKKEDSEDASRSSDFDEGDLLEEQAFSQEGSYPILRLSFTRTRRIGNGYCESLIAGLLPLAFLSIDKSSMFQISCHLTSLLSISNLICVIFL